MAEVLDKMDHMVRIMDVKDKIIFMNEKMKAEFGDFTSNQCFSIMGATKKCAECVSSISRITGKAESKDVIVGNKVFKVIASPVELENGEIYSIEIFNDISKEKEMEREIYLQYDKMKEDIEFAKQIQTQALPKDGKYWDKIILNSKYCPSEELGGDIYDIVKIDEDNIILYMADVSGHGIKSSLITIFLKQILKSLKDKSLDLKGAVNEMIKSFKELNLGDERYFSILLVLYNSTKRELSMLNAGHNCPPLIIRKNNIVEEIQIAGLPICSILKEANQKVVSVPVEKGDKLVLYTDGITEAFSLGKMEYFGSDSIIGILEENNQLDGAGIVDEIMGKTLEFTNQSLIDDAAILIAEIL
ncbi:MAG: PP2C family protein-serine/threonine phosphatase [Eubacteriales bacterium]